MEANRALAFRTSPHQQIKNTPDDHNSQKQHPHLLLPRLLLLPHHLPPHFRLLRLPPPRHPPPGVFLARCHRHPLDSVVQPSRRRHRRRRHPGYDTLANRPRRQHKSPTQLATRLEQTLDSLSSSESLAATGLKSSSSSSEPKSWSTTLRDIFPSLGFGDGISYRDPREFEGGRGMSM